MTYSISSLITEGFEEQPLTSPSSANYEGVCRTAPATPGLPKNTVEYSHLESVHDNVPAQIVRGGEGHDPIIVHILSAPPLPLRQAAQAASAAPEQGGRDGGPPVRVILIFMKF